MTGVAFTITCNDKASTLARDTTLEFLSRYLIGPAFPGIYRFLKGCLIAIRSAGNVQGRIQSSVIFALAKAFLTRHPFSLSFVNLKSFTGPLSAELLHFIGIQFDFKKYGISLNAEHGALMFERPVSYNTTLCLVDPMDDTKFLSSDAHQFSRAVMVLGTIWSGLSRGELYTAGVVDKIDIEVGRFQYLQRSKDIEKFKKDFKLSRKSLKRRAIRAQISNPYSNTRMEIRPKTDDSHRNTTQQHLLKGTNPEYRIDTYSQPRKDANPHYRKERKISSRNTHQEPVRSIGQAINKENRSANSITSHSTAYPTLQDSGYSMRQYLQKESRFDFNPVSHQYVKNTTLNVIRISRPTLKKNEYSCDDAYSKFRNYPRDDNGKETLPISHGDSRAYSANSSRQNVSKENVYLHRVVNRVPRNGTHSLAKSDKHSTRFDSLENYLDNAQQFTLSDSRYHPETDVFNEYRQGTCKESSTLHYDTQLSPLQGINQYDSTHKNSSRAYRHDLNKNKRMYGGDGQRTGINKKR